MLARLLLAILLTLAPALAEAQGVTNHDVPVGKGAGVTGFGSAGPCSANQTIVWSGTSADPACGQAFPAPTRAGDIVYWNGSAWVTLPGNNSSSTPFLSETSSGVPAWSAPPNNSPGYQTFHSAAGNTTITLTTGGCGCSAIPASLGNIAMVAFDGVVQARDTLSSYNAGTGVLTFAAAVPPQVQTVDVIWSFAPVSTVSTVGGLGGAILIGTGLTSSGQTILVDSTVVPELATPNVFISTDAFRGGLSFGTSAPAPATADLYGYNATRSILYQNKRDQILSRGDAAAEFQWYGLNTSSASVQWGEIYGGPVFCRGKPSFGTFPCATGTTTSGSEEGSVSISRTNGGNVTSVATNAATTSGATLSFDPSVQDLGNLAGKFVTNATHPSSIAAGTRVTGMTSTSVFLSANVVSTVSSGDTINFTGPDIDWFDSNGLNIAGQRNLYIPAGQGVVSFDSDGTATYIMSFNSHGGNALDFQSCNNIGVNCLSSTTQIRFYNSASASGGLSLSIQPNGHLLTHSGTAPTFLSCGSSPTFLHGGDHAMSIQPDADTCSVSFGIGYGGDTPICTATSSTALAVGASATGAAVTVTGTGISGTTVNINCTGWN